MIQMGKDHKGVLHLVNTLYVPSAAICLILASQLGLDGLFISIYDGRLLIRPLPTSSTIIAATKQIENNLYVILGSPQVHTRSQHNSFTPSLSDRDTHALRSTSPLPKTQANFVLAPIDPMMLHCRMGHCSMDSVVDMAKHEMMMGMNLSLDHIPPVCKHYILGKQLKVPVLSIHEGQRAIKPLQIVYADIIVSITIAGRQKEEYVLHIIDNYSSVNFGFP